MAFHLFPVELWDMIVLELENVEDALNIYNAFPELRTEGFLFRTRQIWLFEKVIPYILQHLVKGDLLACRQVCRKWSLAVDNFLENHPTRKAYTHQGRQSRKELIREASSNYCTLSEPEPFQLNILLGWESLRKFSQEMVHHPSGRNPFVGRGLKLIREYTYLEPDTSPEDYWTQVFQLIERFGEHIWFLEIAFSFYGDDPEPCEPLTRILPLLPNLKGLSITIDSCDWYEPGSDSQDWVIPNLPQLETLEMDCSILPEFMDHMGFPHVFSNLRKLALSFHHLEWWKDHLNNLTQLTELSIYDANYGSHEEISDLLLSLPSPELFKLTIYGRGRGRRNKLAGTGNIFSWLRRFPKLSILELSINYFPCLDSESGELGEATTSIEALILRDFVGGQQGINLGFLGGFLSLQFLKLIGSPGRESFEKDVIFNRELWSVKCPKLKEITIVEDNDDDEDKCIPVSYSRAKYDYLTRVGKYIL